MTADYVVFWAAIGAVTVVWELRRGSTRLHQRSLLSLAVGLPVMILARRLTGDGVLFTLPLWVAPLAAPRGAVHPRRVAGPPEP
ncbi:hypothetical protein ABT224_22005 [Streptomyces sp. NPDC001584]|uniref:hypothetical protein n=1 Tax=Streptomyces sp. NPDC001584 TaxID=3154521 RepID=UPI003330969C